MEELTNQLQSLFQNLGGRKKKIRKLKIKKAIKIKSCFNSNEKPINTMYHNLHTETH